MDPVLSFYLIGIAALLFGGTAAWRARSVELRDRTLTLLVLLQVVSGAMYVSDDTWRLFCVALGVLALLEMARAAGAHAYLLLLAASLLVLGGAHVSVLEEHWLLGSSGVVLVCAWSIVGIGRGGARAGYFLAWGACFLVPSVMMLIGLRTLSVDWLVVLLLATQANDMLGLMAGKFFGRRPLLPRISPNKTVEGFVASGLGVLVAGAAARWACPAFQQLSWASCLGLLAVLFLAANAGDLLFSRVKRCLGLKDFGDLLPGHGGVLDRIDSLLMAAPALYSYLVVAGVA